MNEPEKDNTGYPEPATLHELAPDDSTEPVERGAQPSLDSTAESAEDRDRLDDLAAVEELARLRAELDAARERLLRQAAEFQNYRRRTEAEKTGAVALGKSVVVQQLLDVFDDFGRSIEAAQRVGEVPDPAVVPDAFVSLRQGVVLVYEKLRGELERLGVEQLEVVGRRFDEAEHEALMQQPAAEGQEPGVVVAELQKGYRMGDRVLRHAKVIVSA